jgi:hypothetical protein
LTKKYKREGGDFLDEKLKAVCNNWKPYVSPDVVIGGKPKESFHGRRKAAPTFANPNRKRKRK